MHARKITKVWHTVRKAQVIADVAHEVAIGKVPAVKQEQTIKARYDAHRKERILKTPLISTEDDVIEVAEEMIRKASDKEYKYPDPDKDDGFSRDDEDRFGSGEIGAINRSYDLATRASVTPTSSINDLEWSRWMGEHREVFTKYISFADVKSAKAWRQDYVRMHIEEMRKYLNT